MFKKRHSQISPLPSPAATQPGGYQQQQQGRMVGPPPQPYRQSSASTVSSYSPDNAHSVRGRQSMQAQHPDHMEELRAGPQYGNERGNGYAGGPPMQRVLSDQKSGKSEKEGKRRSGFFGFGKKKEDKKEQEEKGPMVNNPRPSFNVSRTESYMPSPPGAFPLEPQFPANNGGPSPPPIQGSRVASNPSPRPSGNGDFGPSGQMPKSQSMGFGHQQQRVPEPYRGNMPGHQEERSHGQGRPQGLPKSASMPFDKAIPPTPGNGSPPVEQRGNPLVLANANGGDTERPARERTVSAGSGRAVPPGGQPEWMKEFAPIVELIGMQPQKTYVASPPELEMILARTSAGGQPKQGQPGSASNDWDAVWLQLSGISLSMWSMKETRAAAAKGDKVPPTYFNVTDSSLELLAPLPPPPHRPTSHPHHHVFSLNTAGSNRLLFSCPSEGDIARWTTGLRLAAWERARLEEIYTGHLIKSGGKEPRMDLQKGRMDGWVRVRIMGGTEWKRLWAVISTPNPPPEAEEDKKTKRKSFFGLGGSGGKEEEAVIQEPNTGQPMASFYPEPRTAKNRAMAPVLTIANVTQAYTVFPERLEVISQSNLMKVVGRIGGELVAIEGRLRESGWALIMPDTPEAGTASPPVQPITPLANMLKWVTGVHDVFGLYGRPSRYSWDEKDPKSLFFSYPRGPERNRLFLDIDHAMQADYRLSNLPQIRTQFTSILKKTGLPRSLSQSRVGGQPDQLYADDSDATPPARPDAADYRLPPLSFDQHGNSPHNSQHSIPRSLSPITERTDPSRNNSQRTTDTGRKASGGSGGPMPQGSGSSKLMPDGGLETIADADSPAAKHGELRYASPAQEGELPRVALPQIISAVSRHTADSGPLTSDSIYSQNTDATPTPAQSKPVTPIWTRAPLPPVGEKTDSTPSDPLPITAQPSSTVTAVDPPLAPPIGIGRPPASDSSEGERSIHSPTPRRVASTEFKQDKLFTQGEQPTAQYLMNVVEEPASTSPPPPSGATPVSAGTEKVRPTIITDFSPPKPAAPAAARANEPLGRKPSGARAPPPKKLSGRSSRLGSVDDVESPPIPPVPALPAPEGHTQERSVGLGDMGDDASAYLAYADQPLSATYVEPPKAPPPAEEEHRSSFAPSKAAADRRAKAEQAEKETQNARNLPGGGKRGGKHQAGGTWSDDEDEDEDEVDEAESPVKPRSGIDEMGSRLAGMGQEQSPYPNTGSIGRSGLRALPPVPRPQEAPAQPAQRSQSFYSNGDDLQHPSFPDRPRTRSPAQSQYVPQPPNPRAISQNYGSTPPPGPVPNMAPPASRNTIWNANFAAGHGMPSERQGNKFVELEEPQARLTQAFAPHGLLQAGMQDKEERSAKKQEELAREMGSSLVNVPSKPPPPSAGLLGAVAQHEKERRNAGGIGATLTDREREKRLAEERQRDIEKLQRAQAEHMQQFGQYGQQYGGGYGMGMPQMGMGMGMGMPQMGFNPYQGGFNPYAQQQAMYAAQMAYQNAMMMSAAGSQAGGAQSPDRPSSPIGPGAGAGGSQFGGQGGPGGGGTQSPFQGMPYGWGMSPQMGAPWMSPQPTGSPMMGMPPMGMMGMGQFPSMQFPQQQQGGDYLQPGGPGYGQGGGMPGSRSRPNSFGGSERDRSEDRAGGGGHAS